MVAVLVVAGIAIAAMVVLCVGGHEAIGDVVSRQVVPVYEWDHGFKSDRVVATRYENTHLGYLIGFRANDAMAAHVFDRVEVFQYLESTGGVVIEGGGYPFAETIVKWKFMSSKSEANRFLPGVLRGLERELEELAR